MGNDVVIEFDDGSVIVICDWCGHRYIKDPSPFGNDRGNKFGCPHCKEVENEGR